MALVRILYAGLKRAACGSLQIQDAKNRQKSPSGHHRTTFVALYLRGKGTYRQSEKNLLSSNICSTCSHNMVNFGPLVAEIDSVGSLGPPANFNGFRVLEALQHGTPVLRVSQTLRR